MIVDREEVTSPGTDSRQVEGGSERESEPIDLSKRSSYKKGGLVGHLKKKEEWEEDHDVDLSDGSSDGGSGISISERGYPDQRIPNDEKKKMCNLWTCVSNFMRGPRSGKVAHRVRPKRDCDETAIIRLTLAAESWRFISYLAFWCMTLLAVIITRVSVVDKLAAGPKEDGNQCAPFNQPKPGKGLGFDYDTESHLIQSFGYGNICTNWDYSPSREIVALFYPIFEYTLLLYLVLDFFTIALSYRRGELTKSFWTFAKIVFPFQISFCAWFRMIFVVLAYENVGGHTAGFLAMQTCLLMVSIQNALYILDSQVAYKFLGGLRNTRIVTSTYLFFNTIFSILKVTSTLHVVITGEPLAITKKKMLGESSDNSIVIGQFLDYVWMLFNSIIPLVISFIRAKSEHALKVTIAMEKQTYLDDDAN